MASEPQLAQGFVPEITQMFLQQNVIQRAQAEDTTDFINRQLQEAKSQVGWIDAKLADFQGDTWGPSRGSPD